MKGRQERNQQGSVSRNLNDWVLVEADTFAVGDRISEEVSNKETTEEGLPLEGKIVVKP
jgi:hypothetical protein